MAEPVDWRREYAGTWRGYQNGASVAVVQGFRGPGWRYTVGESDWSEPYLSVVAARRAAETRLEASDG